MGQSSLDSRSFLNRYLRDTWSAEEWKTSVDIAHTEDETAHRAAAQKIHDTPRSTSSRATPVTHPFEDFAESFGSWCAFGSDASDHVEGKPGDGKEKLDWIEQDAVTKIGQQLTPGCQRLRAFAR